VRISFFNFGLPKMAVDATHTFYASWPVSNSCCSVFVRRRRFPFAFFGGGLPVLAAILGIGLVFLSYLCSAIMSVCMLHLPFQRALPKLHRS
jgi:hypothetical protein